MKRNLNSASIHNCEPCACIVGSCCCQIALALTRLGPLGSMGPWGPWSLYRSLQAFYEAFVPCVMSAFGKSLSRNGSQFVGARTKRLSGPVYELFLLCAVCLRRIPQQKLYPDFWCLYPSIWDMSGPSVPCIQAFFPV